MTLKTEAPAHVRETGWTRYLLDRAPLVAPRAPSEALSPTLRESFHLDRTAVPLSKAGASR